MQPRQNKHKHFSYQCLGKVQAKPEAIGDIHFSLCPLKMKKTWGGFVRDPEEQAISTMKAGTHQFQNAWQGGSAVPAPTCKFKYSQRELQMSRMP